MDGDRYNNMTVPDGLTRNGPDGPDTSAFELEDFLTFRLVALSRLVERVSKREYAESFGISVAEWRVLAMLANFGDKLVNELASKAEYDKSQISRAVTSLEARGYVCRTAHHLDKRSTYLSLTPAGQDVYEAAIPLGRERQRLLLSVLTPEQRRELYTALDILTAHLRQNDPQIASAMAGAEKPLSQNS